jgi:epoxide hydrolase 4
MLKPGMRSAFADVDGVRLHYVEQGTGPLLLMLHGFPDFWYSWRFQMPALAAAGYRVVAPDLRGYNLSSKPAGVRAYSVRRVAADVASLIGRLGERRAIVAGHDWGGVVAWQLAARRPDVVDRLIVLNAPHPAAMRRELLTGTQPLRSWYVGFFQIPWLPERLLRARNRALLVHTLGSEVQRPGAFTDADAAAYRAAFASRATMTAAVNYYRALFRGSAVEPATDSNRRRAHGGPRSRSAYIRGRIVAPVLLLWGERDPHLGVGLTRRLERWVPHLAVERYGDAGHWVHWDAADAVNARILEFLGSARAEPGHSGGKVVG